MRSNFIRMLALTAMVVLLAVPAASAQRPLTGVESEVAAMMARGQALNKLHHLGTYARPTKAELRALRLRGEALNQLYGLGGNKVAGQSFEWGDAGIGSAATLGAVLLGLAAAVTFRRRRRDVATA
jgi:LPXTG-motif cell wall-anchored protein